MAAVRSGGGSSARDGAGDFTGRQRGGCGGQGRAATETEHAMPAAAGWLAGRGMVWVCRWLHTQRRTHLVQIRIGRAGRQGGRDDGRRQ